jgi:tellurite resistance protein
MSNDPIVITTSHRIDRKPSDVQAQYRDMDHHMRNNVHPGIHFSWEPSKDEQRKIRTEFRLLGKKQHDVALLIDAPDGTFVLDYLEGANAGTKIVHEFLPVEGSPDATLVRITANVPATLTRKLLGALFKMGVKQVINKALREDKADLEGRSFDANALSGNVMAALKLLEPLRERVDLTDGLGEERTMVALRIATFVAAADGERDPIERDALLKVAKRIGSKGVDEAWVDKALEEASVLAGDEEIVRHGEALGARCKELGLGAEAFVPAAIVAHASFGVAMAELAILQCVARGAQLPDTAIESSLAAAGKALAHADFY